MKYFELVTIGEDGYPIVYSEFYRAENVQSLFPIVDAKVREEEEEDERFYGWKEEDGVWSREKEIHWDTYRFEIREIHFADVDGVQGVQRAS